MVKSPRKSAATPIKTPKAPPKPTPRSRKAEHGVPGLPLMRLYRRRQDNMSQEELAGRVGVTQGMISQWESGESDIPLGMVHKLAKALNTTAHALQTINPFSSEATVAELFARIPEGQRAQAVRVLKSFTE